MVKVKNGVMDLGEHKLYNVSDFLDSFEEWFGMGVAEVSDFLMNYHLISVSELVNYIDNNFNLMEELKYNSLVISREKIINSRMKDYEYYREVLTILSSKGIYYLSLLRYLCSLSKIDVKLAKYEVFFKEADIYHFESATTGRELNRILGALSNVVMQMQNILIRANKLENYNKTRIDDFARIFGYDTIYPTTKLVLDDNDCLSDKTSLTKGVISSKRSNFSYVKVKKMDIYLNNR